MVWVIDWVIVVSAPGDILFGIEGAVGVGLLIILASMVIVDV